MLTRTIWRFRTPQGSEFELGLISSRPVDVVAKTLSMFDGQPVEGVMDVFPGTPLYAFSLVDSMQDYALHGNCRTAAEVAEILAEYAPSSGIGSADIDDLCGAEPCEFDPVRIRVARLGNAELLNVDQ